MLEKEVSAHKKEIKTRDLAINEKEKVRNDLKFKICNLFQFSTIDHLPTNFNGIIAVHITHSTPTGLPSL